MTGRLRIDLEALTANYELFRSAAAPGHETGAVVKANGYGVGMTAAALRLHQAGCRSFFVATLDEALDLRAALDQAAAPVTAQSLSPGERSGPATDVYFFEGVTGADAAAAAAAHDVIPILNDLAQVALWIPHRERPAALHIDTGMTRLGVMSDELTAALSMSSSGLEALNLTLLMSHFACADDPQHPMNAAQLKRFEALRANFPGIRTSLGNSAACLTGPEWQGQLGRPGIGLYGGNPFAEGPSPVRPVAALEGQVLQLKEAPAGTTVGYSASRRLDAPARLAVVGIGYEDGVPWSLSDCGVMAAGEARCPILGRISMDSTVIDTSAATALKVGDWVQCYGDLLSVDEVAAAAGTFAYELLTRAGNRLARVPATLGRC
ncbi:MAG: alanine racemase [Pseudomonadota bacterium]